MYMGIEEYTARTKKIILELINKKMVIDSIELNNLAEEILNISYSIGGGYDEGTIKRIAQVKIKQMFNI